MRIGKQLFFMLDNQCKFTIILAYFEDDFIVTNGKGPGKKGGKT
jgi:hypothetical protein